MEEGCQEENARGSPSLRILLAKSKTTLIRKFGLPSFKREKRICQQCPQGWRPRNVCVVTFVTVEEREGVTLDCVSYLAFSPLGLMIVSSIITTDLR